MPVLLRIPADAEIPADIRKRDVDIGSRRNLQQQVGFRHSDGSPGRRLADLGIPAGNEALAGGADSDQPVSVFGCSGPDGGIEKIAEFSALDGLKPGPVSVSLLDIRGHLGVKPVECRASPTGIGRHQPDAVRSVVRILGADGTAGNP